MAVGGIAAISYGAYLRQGIPMQAPQPQSPSAINAVHAVTSSAQLAQCTNKVLPALAASPLNGSIANITFNVCNDEGYGSGGWYWSIGNYTKNVQIKSIGNNSYYVMVTFNGTWATVAGARSPNNGITEPANGSGTFHEVYYAQVPGQLNRSMTLNGFIGSFNFGGTTADLRKLYGTQSGDPTPYLWSVPYLHTTPPYFKIIGANATFLYGNTAAMVSTINSSAGMVDHGDVVT